MSSSKELFKLNEKVVLITGAAGIIGSVVSRSVLEAGAKLIMVDFNAKALDEVSKKEWFTKDRILSITADVTKPADVKSAVAQGEKHFGKIDVLFNNAAGKSSSLDKFFAPFEEYSLDTWQEVMATNIDGMMLMAQAVGKQMIEKKIKGSIIQTASIYGMIAPDQRIYEGSFYLDKTINTPAVYSASKGAVIALTRYLAVYWANVGIRVNTLTPGGIQSGQNQVFIEKYSSKVPLGRMAKAEEMAGAVIYLASDASSYVTGQNLVVDGGFTVL